MDSCKAWYNVHSTKLVVGQRVTDRPFGEHHTEIVLDNPHAFDFENVVGQSAEEFSKTNLGPDRFYNQDLIDKFLDVGWVRLGFNIKRLEPYFWVEAQSTKYAAIALKAFRDYVTTKNPIAADVLEISLEIHDIGFEGLLHKTNAEIFLKTGRIRQMANVFESVSAKSAKAWYNINSKKMVVVKQGQQHTEWVITHPEDFDFEKIMGMGVNVYLTKLQDVDPEYYYYDENLIEAFLNVGWVRLGFEAAKDYNRREEIFDLYVESLNEKNAAVAARAFIKYLLPHTPLASETPRITVSFPYGRDVTLYGDDAENFLRTGRAKQSEQVFEALSIDNQAFRKWFSGSKVVDANGNPLPVYHGTSRPDRVGTRFRKARATAGPMAYFTDDPEIASNYASSKPDTSIGDESSDYGSWFKVKVRGYRSGIDIDRAWWALSEDEKQHISKLAPRICTDDTGENIILGPNTNKTGNGGYYIEQHRGNALKALVDAWLYSGALCGEEEDFLKVLKLAGMTSPVKLEHPDATYPFVYQVFLRITNPLISTSIPENVLKALQRAVGRQPIKRDTGGYQWDKKSSDAREWLKALMDDIQKTGGTLSWTVIPDWVTKVLQSLGYDGIKDVGGKHGGRGHDVWIPFHEYQVKSAISNTNFNLMKNGIHESIVNETGLTIYGQGEISNPTDAMVEFVRRSFEAHPNLKNYVDVTITVKDSHTVELTFIETEHQKRHGHAGVVLDMLCKAADQFGVTIKLQASPSTLDQRRIRNSLRLKDLEAFYGRRGFDLDDPSDTERLMTRKPVSKQTVEEMSRIRNSNTRWRKGLAEASRPYGYDQNRAPC